MSMELCWPWDLNQEMGCHFLLLLSSSSVSSGAIGRRGEMKLWRLALLFCSRGAHFEYGPLKRIEISQGRRDGRDIRPCVTLWPLFVSTWLEEKKEPRVFRCISVCLGVRVAGTYRSLLSLFESRQSPTWPGRVSPLTPPCLQHHRTGTTPSDSIILM